MSQNNFDLHLKTSNYCYYFHTPPQHRQGYNTQTHTHTNTHTHTHTHTHTNKQTHTLHFDN